MAQNVRQRYEPTRQGRGALSQQLSCRVQIGAGELSGTDSPLVSVYIVAIREVIQVKVDDLQERRPERYMRRVTVTGIFGHLRKWRLCPAYRNRASINGEIVYFASTSEPCR